MNDAARHAFRRAVRQAQLGNWLCEYRDTWIGALPESQLQEPLPVMKRANQKQ